MKKLLFISLVFVVLSCQEKEANPPPIVGTWEYTGSLQGRAIFTETHFIWIYKSPEDTLFTLAGAGTHSYSPSDSLFTWNTTYSTIPGMAGTSFQTTGTFEGDMTYFKVLDSIGFEGSAKRIAR